MDFNSQHASFGAPFSTSSPQHSHLYTAADPHARLQQPGPNPNSSFNVAYGQFPNGQAASFPTMAGPGAVMQMPPSQSQLHHPRAALQQQQQQQPQQQQQLSPYSSAPFSQTLPSPAHQQFAQNRNTASPASVSGQAFAPPQQQHQQSPSTLAPNGQQQQRNAPSVVKSEMVQTPVKATVPPSPVSPVAQVRSDERMATLLEINSLLIKEACELQVQGKAGQIGPPEENKPLPSKEYVEYVRRLQANLSYMAQQCEKHVKPNQVLQPGPAIMSAPSTPDELVKLYIKLQSLFPGWKGQSAPVKQSPGSQRMNSTSSNPPSSAGLQQNWGQNAMQQAMQTKAEPIG